MLISFPLFTSFRNDVLVPQNLQKSFFKKSYHSELMDLIIFYVLLMFKFFVQWTHFSYLFLVFLTCPVFDSFPTSWHDKMFQASFPAPDIDFSISTKAFHGKTVNLTLGMFIATRLVLVSRASQSHGQNINIKHLPI